MQTRGTNSRYETGHQHLSALYGNICNRCGNSETIYTMLTTTDALRDANLRNNNDEWKRSGNTILNYTPDCDETKLHILISEKRQTTSDTNMIVSSVGHLRQNCTFMKQSAPSGRAERPGTIPGIKTRSWLKPRHNILALRR
jgi:hypothetical protein